MPSPRFNYRSCQSRWKNTAPDKARPHSLNSHRLYSHPEMHRHPSANSQIKTLRLQHFVAPNSQVTLQCWIGEWLWHLRNRIDLGKLKQEALYHTRTLTVNITNGNQISHSLSQSTDCCNYIKFRTGVGCSMWQEIQVKRCLFAPAPPRHTLSNFGCWRWLNVHVVKTTA